MLSAERLDIIRKHVIQNKYGNINDLAAMLNTSPATIRRCFKQLEEEKLVESIRGGVVLASTTASILEQPYMVKRQHNSEEKIRIAQAACRYINPNDSIFLDSSSTVYEMCANLQTMKALKISTNDVLIASTLNGLDDCTVMVTGGTVRKGYYTLTGFFAQESIQQIHVDTYFTGVDAITPNGDFMITNTEEVDIKRYLMENANRCVVLCDHEKFNCTAFLHLWNHAQVDAVITGKELNDELFNQYIELGMPLIRV
ncbi:MAG: DeoR/GlpR transcriptional regulator [Anaerotruncus sp.]|nr:DeoR/GlpR transcriptional regulator [Anaerotruncus sp.]